MNGDDIINFGKYKGTPINKVPKGYLGWLIQSGNMDMVKVENLEKKQKTCDNCKNKDIFGRCNELSKYIDIDCNFCVNWGDVLVGFECKPDFYCKYWSEKTK